MKVKKGINIEDDVLQLELNTVGDSFAEVIGHRPGYRTDNKNFVILTINDKKEIILNKPGIDALGLKVPKLIFQSDWPEQKALFTKDPPFLKCY
jgi:hypothetical protein